MELKEYRDTWLAEKADDFIGFYNREFFCLDNFSSFAIIKDGTYYPTVEHAYQCGKFEGVSPEIADEIRGCLSAYEAQKTAHRYIDRQRADWNDVKVDYMEKLLRLKLEQHPYVKKKLLQTENYQICEDSPKDAFWGIGQDRGGQNRMGKLWMKLRAELQN